MYKPILLSLSEQNKLREKRLCSLFNPSSLRGYSVELTESKWSTPSSTPGTDLHFELRAQGMYTQELP